LGALASGGDERRQFVGARDWDELVHSHRS
jgi:hypothetical protein